MSDAHDLHVLNQLIRAIRETQGAPSTAADGLEAQTRTLGEGEPGQNGDGASVIDAAKDALSGLLGGRGPSPVGDGAQDGLVRRLNGLLDRMEAAMGDDRLSGASRDAVIRAFDPVKAARDAALQQEPD